MYVYEHIHRQVLGICLSFPGVFSCVTGGGGIVLYPAVQGAAASEGDEMAALETKLGAAGLPEEASEVVRRDLARLKRMQPTQPEYTVR